MIISRWGEQKIKKFGSCGGQGRPMPIALPPIADSGRQRRNGRAITTAYIGSGGPPLAPLVGRLVGPPLAIRRVGLTGTRLSERNEAAAGSVPPQTSAEHPYRQPEIRRRSCKQHRQDRNGRLTDDLHRQVRHECRRQHGEQHQPKRAPKERFRVQRERDQQFPQLARQCFSASDPERQAEKDNAARQDRRRSRYDEKRD